MNSVMETVCSVCNKVQTNSGDGILFPKLMINLRKEFKIHDIELKIRSRKDKSLAPAEFYVNAYYDSYDDQQLDVPIEVIVNNNFNKDQIWDRSQTKDFLIQVFDAVVHERNTNVKVKNDIMNNIGIGTTLATIIENTSQDPDEIDAYALSIAIELCRTLGKHRACIYMPKFTTLARMKIRDQFVSPNLHAYVSHFEKPISPLLRRLAKKIYIRLKKIDTDYIFQ